MNIEFKYDKGSKKIVVSNEFGELIEREYFDNINEILIEENIIEEIIKAIEINYKEQNALLKEIKSLEQKIKFHEQEINVQKEEIIKERYGKKKQKKQSLKTFFCVFAVFTMCFGLDFFFISEKTLKLFATLFSIDVTISGLFSVICYYFEEYKRYTKPYHTYSIKELEYQIEDLKLSSEEKKNELELNEIQGKILMQTLKKETQKYEELQEIQSREKEERMENDNQIIRVEYRNRLKRIKDYIMLQANKEANCEYDNDQALVFFLNHKIEDTEK